MFRNLPLMVFAKSMPAAKLPAEPKGSPAQPKPQAESEHARPHAMRPPAPPTLGKEFGESAMQVFGSGTGL
ncbi:hypothetical protein [Deinococcus arenicola]|uniref:Uncharacterized protein n=1 Tax=Deinococcus arenicola TaxID=2994950 RepID=A0ABU4DP12_9DEIO|nr:hypothetical protein [Deinococcus sp. ZS9-10]MDV6374161.1 hypothetical protein [Deinococcus sp. ZS9-10]